MATITEKQREEKRQKFLTMKKKLQYAVGNDEVAKAIDEAKKTKKTPSQWLKWIENLKIQCPVCKGSGVYRYGTNGKHQGPCFRCASKGHMTHEDGGRCRYYDNHHRKIQ
jgi:hypothetical protein